MASMESTYLTPTDGCNDVTEATTEETGVTTDETGVVDVTGGIDTTAVMHETDKTDAAYVTDLMCFYVCSRCIRRK